MSDGLAAEKSALRQAMRAAREGLDADRRVSLTIAAVERLLELPAFERLEGRVFAGYVAIGGELSPAGALAFVRDQGGAVALPRVSDAPPRLRFHTLTAETRLRLGGFRPPGPPQGAAPGPAGAPAGSVLAG